MSRSPNWTRIPFLIVVALCLAQIAWWVVYQYLDSSRVETSEKVKLEALCYRALVSISRAVADTEAPRELFLRELSIDEFRDLELAEQQGTSVKGVRIDTVMSHVSPEFGRMYVRPKESAVETVLRKARSKRRMFTSEGIAFTVVALLGIVLLYNALGRERRMRRLHESFVAGATHEMKTPLATLRLGLETLEQGWTDRDSAQGYLGQLVGQVDRLRMQIDNLLREAHGSDERLNLLPGELQSDVREVVASFDARLPSRKVDIAVELPESPVLVRRDKEALQQVIRNLIDNALKYSPKDGTIHVCLTADGRAAKLAVRDEGPGITDTDRPLVFEKFYRGQTQPTEARGGTGLGLYVSRQMVTAHGGSLDVGKDASSGACFELVLPVHANGGGTA